MDLAEILMTNGGAPANKRNWRRKELCLYEGFSALIKDAEAGGASVLAIRNKKISDLGAGCSSEEKREFYRSGFFSAIELAPLQREFQKRRALYLSKGMPDYSLSVLGAVLLGKETSDGDALIALGYIGSKVVANIIRDLLWRCAGEITSSRNEITSTKTAQEVLYEFKLIDISKRRERPSGPTSIGNRISARDAAAVDPSDETQPWSFGEDGGNYKDGSPPISSSSYIPGHGLLEFMASGLPSVVCVAEKDDGGDSKNRTYAMPQYDQSGIRNRRPPLLLIRPDRAVTAGTPSICSCPYSRLGRSVLSGAYIPGCDRNRCFHESIFDNDGTSNLLRAKLCLRPASVPVGSPYFIILSPHVESSSDYANEDSNFEAILHVFVHVPGALGVARGVNENAVLTLTPGNGNCSECHNGGKQDVGADRQLICPHCSFILETVGKSAEEAATKAAIDIEEELVAGVSCYTVRDFQRISATLFSSGSSTAATTTTFNVATGIWESPSLSAKMEKDNFERLGFHPRNVQKCLDEIDPVGCNLGGASHVNYDSANPIILVEQVPTSFLPPLHNKDGCVYSNSANPGGWKELETDGNGRAHVNCKAHFLTHTRYVQVYTRNCSWGHPECRVCYTGRHEGLHRHSSETIIRHEVILLFWRLTKTMHGPGAQSYGDLVRQLHRLGGSGTKGNDHFKTLFIQNDCLRACIYGYLARQRRVMKKPCPSCPRRQLPSGEWASMCPNVTVDAKRLGIPLPLHTGVSPDQVSLSSPVVDVKMRNIAQRYFWSSEIFKQVRALARALAGDILRINPRKGEEHFKESQIACLLESAPEPYRPALSLLVDAFKTIGGSAALQQDPAANGEEDDEQEHGKWHFRFTSYIDISLRAGSTATCALIFFL